LFLRKACTHPQNPQQFGKVSIHSFDISPSKGKVGSKFELTINYDVEQRTSTGEVVLEVVPPAGMPFGDGFLVANGQPKGAFSKSWSFEAQPTQMQPFMAGIYQAFAFICDGSCGSKHRWAKQLATSAKNFTIN